MLNISEESDLRNRVADLVVEWHDRHRGPVNDVEGDDYLDLVSAAAIVNEEGDLALHRWVSAARRADLSWEQIGGVLGVSRQAAQKRFAPKLAADDGDDAAHTIVRRGVTAFNEVEVLEELGAEGYAAHSAGWGKLRFVRADGPVENVRVVSLRAGRAVEEMEADGWTHVFSWYPYTYFTRPAR